MSRTNVFSINDFIKLKLERGLSNIYIKGELFTQCKYLLLDVPLYYKQNVEMIDSIDEASQVLDRSLESRNGKNLIQPEVEFWGHCSNLQAWAENNYDTRLLHRNLAFPLLKKLTDVGDPMARRVFKEEIARRLEQKYLPVIHYLVREDYLSYLSDEEFESLDESTTMIVKEVLKGFHQVKTRRSVPRIVTRPPIPEDHNIETWLERIEWFVEKHLFRNAISELKRLYDINPNHRIVLLKLGDLYFHFQDYNNSLKYYLKLLHHDSRNVYALSKIAIIYFNLGFTRSTFKICRKILEINPQFFIIFGLIRDLALSKYRKAFECMTSFIHDQVQANRIDYITDFLNKKCIAFFTVEELEQLFEAVDIEHQELLRTISKLINRKRVIEKLKARGTIKITEERIRISHSDF